MFSCEGKYSLLGIISESIGYNIANVGDNIKVWGNSFFYKILYMKIFGCKGIYFHIGKSIEMIAVVLYQLWSWKCLGEIDGIGVITIFFCKDKILR